MDKCLIFSNLEVAKQIVTLMKTKPLTQLRELIASALKSQTNLSKSFQTFFIETMELVLTHTGRLNFTQMARCGRSCESRFRQNFRKSFDWLSFYRSFLESTKGHRIATPSIRVISPSLARRLQALTGSGLDAQLP